MSGQWRSWGVLLGMASGNIIRFRWRSLVVLLCLLAVSIPLLTALALQQGVKRQALAMLQSGPDLLITGDDFGKPCAVPIHWVETVSRIPGVRRVTPRAVGRVLIEDLPAVLVGLGSSIGSDANGWDDALPAPGRGEFSVGAAIAGHYGIAVDQEMKIPLPVEGPEQYRYRTFRVVGLHGTEHQPVWSAGLILGHLADVQEIFLRPGMATELMVHCHPGHQERISLEVPGLLGPGAKIQDRKMMEDYFHGGFDRRGGVFLVYYLVVMVMVIPLLAVASGIGLSNRRREVAVMKSMGWETHEVLLLSTLESLLVAVAGASLAVIGTLLWLHLASAWPLHRFFIPGAEEMPYYILPYQLCWTPVVLVYVFSVSVTISGALAASWRAASVEPGTILLGGGR